MADPAKAIQTQLANIETRTGKTLAQLSAIVKKSGLQKHSEIRDMLKSELGMGHGDANTLAHLALGTGGLPGAAAPALSADDALDALYTGSKAELRPIHDRLMKAIEKFGKFEVAPKKTYVSLRRAKQFAMIGPATKTAVEVGLNMKGVKGSARLVEQPAGGMCQYKVRLSSVAEVDAALVAWLKTAFDASA